MIMVASLSVMMLSTVSLTAYHVNALLCNLETEAATLTQLMGTNVSAAMVYFTDQIAKYDLGSLQVKPEIAHAVLFDKYGQFVTYYVNPDNNEQELDFKHYNLLSYYQTFMQETADLPNGRKSEITEEYIKSESSTLLKDGLIKWNKNDVWAFRLTAFREIHPISTEYEGYVGFIAIQFDLHQSIYQLLHTILFVLLTVAIAGIVIFILAHRMQKSISMPIYSLLNAMQNISTHKNYALRAEKYVDDELGQLTEQFNYMLSQIEMRDRDLDIYRNHLEEKVMQRTADLEAAMKQAISANKAKSIFIANMSHEIRTPLNSVLGFAQILSMESDLSKEHKKHVKNIYNSGNHLLRLINDILEFSKIDANAVKLNQEPFYLDELIHVLDAMFSLRCQQKHISWQLNSDIKVGHAVIGDQGKLRQILINLLGNATKFTEQGGVALHVSQHNNIYTFIVEDSGPGIGETAQACIFSPFYQEKLGLDKGGAGLGLAISKHYIELMQGELSFVSKKQQGTRFFAQLVLPPAEASMLVNYALDTPIEHLHLPVDIQLKALVVDDIEDNRQTVTFILTAIGAEVMEADNGRQALLQVEQKRPDIIFMDIRMPIMDGREALQVLRSSLGTNCPPCVAVTASAFAEDSEQLYQDGFAEVITKPFRFAQIYQCITKLLEINLVEIKHIQQHSSCQLSPLDIEKHLHKLPSEVMHNFREAAQLYEVTRLTALLNELKQASDDNELLVDCLQGYLSNYDMDGLLAFLDKAHVN